MIRSSWGRAMMEKKIYVEDVMFECGDNLEYEQYVMNLNNE